MHNLKASMKAAGFPLVLASALLTSSGCTGGAAQTPSPAGSYQSSISDNGASVAAERVATSANATHFSSQVHSPRVASYSGCNIYPSGDYFNATVLNLAIDPHSAQFLASIAAAGDVTGFYLSTGIQHLNIAYASTPKVKVYPKVSWHTFPDPFPFIGSFKFESSGDSDDETLLVTPPACHLYEAYSSSYSSGRLSAYSGRDDNLSLPMQILPNGSPGSSASGLPHFPGMIKWSEMQSGNINHALYFSAWSNTLCNCYVKPASDTDGLNYQGPSTNYKMPYGARIRLKSSFDDSKFGPQAKVVATALKQYGGFVADTGSHYANNNAIFSIDDTSNPSGWNREDLAALAQIRYSDFEVLPIGSVTQR
jgi:hypothetical protein